MERGDWWYYHAGKCSNTEYVYRQSFRRMDYQSGKSHLILATCNFWGQDTDVVKRVGYFDANNGIFLEVNGTEIKWVIRKNAVDTNAVLQNEWNIDIMNGSRQANNQSGFTLDISKIQILIIDFEWLGTGVVRLGFLIDGIPFYVHTFHNANINETIYMETPNLPVRYEISSSGGSGKLDHICSTVMSEGGREDSGFIHGVAQQKPADASASYSNANSIGTRYALLGLRLKSTALGSTIILEDISIISVTSDNYLWEILIDPTVAGTFTYAGIGDEAVEIAYGDVVTNPSSNTVGTDGHIIMTGYGSGSSTIDIKFPSNFSIGSAIDGTPQELILCVTPLTSNLDIAGAINWREL